MYRERMLGYYPPVIQNTLEFQAIIDAEYPEIENLATEVTKATDNAYLLTMDESRIKQWEALLSIRPIEGSSIEDRRETIIARIRGQGKLNTNLINTIVGTFTGGTADSYIADSTLYVEITPPPGNKSYQFANVEQELSKKVPAHLQLVVRRNYNNWSEIEDKSATWNDVKTNFSTWNDVLMTENL